MGTTLDIITERIEFREQEWRIGEKEIEVTQRWERAGNPRPLPKWQEQRKETGGKLTVLMLPKPRIQYHSMEAPDYQAGGGATEEMQQLQEVSPNAEQEGERYPDFPQVPPHH